MDPRLEQSWRLARRSFLSRSAHCLGTAALASLLNVDAAGSERDTPTTRPPPACRIFQPRRNASSICSSRARRRRWTCSTTSRS